MSLLIIILICYHSILNWVDTNLNPSYEGEARILICVDTTHTSINEGEVRNSFYVDKDKE